MAAAKKKSYLRGSYQPGPGVVVDKRTLLRASGLERDAERLRSIQARMESAYESGRLSEGDRLAAKADVLEEKIDNALIALEEEGEPQQEPIVQSVTRQFADAWQSCMRDEWNASCRDAVNEYRRTGHGKWNPPSRVFIGPVSKWGTASAGEHPEWYREEPGYFEDPTILHQLRDIVGNPNADGLLLLDAAEDAWNSIVQTMARMRAGAEKRRAAGIDSLKEVKLALRRITRKKKRTSRKPTPNRRRTSKRKV